MTNFKETEVERKEWSGWVLVGQQLEAPRKMRLSPSEARLLGVLLDARGKVVSAIELRTRAKIRGKTVTARSLIDNLRSAVGRDSIPWRRNAGFRIVPARVGRGPSHDPLSELVKTLTAALATAKALKRQMA